MVYPRWDSSGPLNDCPATCRRLPTISIMRPWFVQLEATGVDGTRAEFTFERRVAGPGVTRHPIRSDGIVGTLFLPPGDGPHPAVVVLNGGGGGIDEYRGAILASYGYAALNLGYFGMEGLPRGLVNIPLEYFENAIRWMRAQPWLRDHFLAVWESCGAANLHCCLARPSPRSTPSSHGCRVGSCSGRLDLPSPVTRGHVRHGRSVESRCRICRRTTPAWSHRPPLSPSVRWLSRRSTLVTSAMPSPWSVRRSPWRRRGDLFFLSRERMIRCGHRQSLPTSRCADLRRIVIPIRSGI